MKIVLETLKLKDFKGVRSLTINVGTSVTEIFGDNATGKTTVFDAFLWLLFDKDSKNRKDFEIKTLDLRGEPIHGLNHEVEAVFTINGRSLVLKKSYSEKWTKRRGSATSEFSGHTTDYFIDGVPVKQKEYKDKVDAIVDEKVFKLLTSPTYFNEQMTWQERRKTLLDVCGDITDEEVVASNEELSILPSILNGRSIEDHRKVIAARRAEINKELEKIPVRVDEARRSKPDTNGLDEYQLETQISRLRSDIESKEMELSRLQSGGEASVQEKRLREIESEMLQIKNEFQQGTLKAVNDKRVDVMKLENDVRGIESEIRLQESRMSSNATVIESKRDEASRLRNQWTEVDSETFESKHDENCPTCGQSLPQEQIQAAHDKALANFNLNKSERLERITAQGKRLVAEIEKLESDNAELHQRIQQLHSDLEAKHGQLNHSKQELETMSSGLQDVTTLPQYTAKVSEHEQVKEKIESLKTSISSELERVRSEIADLRTELRVKETQKASFAQVLQADHRIEELENQERTLAEEYERLEHQLFLTEEFIRTKVNLLESKINSKFQYARFKLFEQQINGGLAETCETLFDGVSYGGGLNNAARINVGLDIIRTLSEHYGITAPIFIDNAESVTKLFQTNSQVIALYVSEQDKSLRVEVVEDMKEAV